MGITVLFVTHNIDDAVYSASGASDVVVTDRDHGEYCHRSARRTIAAQNAFLTHFAELHKHRYTQIHAAKQVPRLA